MREFEPLLDASLGFLHSPDLSSLLERVQNAARDLTGCLAAQVLLAAEGSSAVTDDLAVHLGLSDLSEPISSSSDGSRRLEPFAALGSAVTCGETGQAAAALRGMRPAGWQAVACPLVGGGVFWGLLVCRDQAPGNGQVRFSEADKWTLSYLARFAAEALRVEEIARDREARDGLTGLFNQAYLRRELDGMLRRGSQLGVVLLDIDFFKRINDTAGHQTGDMVLRRLSGYLQAAVRAGDLAVRYGGEEFCLVLPRAGEAEAARLAERLRVTLDELTAADWAPYEHKVTVSCGVAGTDTVKAGTSVADLLEAADQSLYHSKRTGRNKVTRHSERILSA